jgi:hypothetical protein
MCEKSTIYENPQNVLKIKKPLNYLQEKHLVMESGGKMNAALLYHMFFHENYQKRHYQY